MTEKKHPLEKPNIKNLAVRVASDPNLMKLFSKLTEPQYRIPIEYEEEIKKLRDISSTEKGILVSKVTSAEDYQTQLKLLSAVQHLLERSHDINTNLYVILAKYKELFKLASRMITLGYFDELNILKDGVRKSVVLTALYPIQEGLDRVENLIILGEGTYKHLTATNFNIKAASTLIQEYMSLFKFGSNVRLPPDQEV